MIETTGTNGIGLFAWSGDSGATGDTVAINRGTIVTRGDMVVAQVGGWDLLTPGIQAESAAGDATIENDGMWTRMAPAPLALLPFRTAVMRAQ